MYNEAECASHPGLLAMDRKPTAREQLARQKKALEQSLEDVNAAITALNEHPEVERVLTLVGRAVRL